MKMARRPQRQMASKWPAQRFQRQTAARQTRPPTTAPRSRLQTASRRSRRRRKEKGWQRSHVGNDWCWSRTRWLTEHRNPTRSRKKY